LKRAKAERKETETDRKTERYTKMERKIERWREG
jgi:hypothetical protein